MILLVINNKRTPFCSQCFRPLLHEKTAGGFHLVGTDRKYILPCFFIFKQIFINTIFRLFQRCSVYRHFFCLKYRFNGYLTRLSRINHILLSIHQNHPGKCS